MRRLRALSWPRRSLGALLGLVSGTLLGFYLTMAIFVAKARAGDYLYSLHDLTGIRWEALPTILGLVGGAWLGWRSLRAVGVGLLATVAGALLLVPVGWFGGRALWIGTSAPWAGAVLASAVGIPLGAIAAVILLRRGGDSAPE